MRVEITVLINHKILNIKINVNRLHQIKQKIYFFLSVPFSDAISLKMIRCKVMINFFCIAYVT